MHDYREVFMNQSRALAILIAILALSLGGCGESPMLVVRGTLVGSDGAPMPLAHVHLLRPMEHPLASAEADMIGRFEVTTVTDKVTTKDAHGVEQHVELAEMTMAHVRTELECGRDVVVLMDSITRMGRTFNLKGTSRVQDCRLS